MSLQYRPITGRYLNIDGTPKHGYIEFTPTAPQVSTGEAILPLHTVAMHLDFAGYISGELACTDSPGVNPTGWVWSVEEKVENGNRWYLYVPIGDGSVLDIIYSYSPGMAPPTYQIQGTPGPPGADGAPGQDGTIGVDGAPGVGVNPGGTINQVLAKVSSTDYDTTWVDQTGGGGVADHGELTGLSDPDHPIAAVVGLQTALDGKAPISHSHPIGDLPSTLATDAEVTSAISTHAATAGHELLSSTTPADLGVAAVGSGTTTARSNHVHKMPTAADVGASASSHNHSGVYDPAGTAASVISTHAAAADPHTGYQKESEKGAVNGYASLDSGGLVPTAQLPVTGGTVEVFAQTSAPTPGSVAVFWVDTDDTSIAGSVVDVAWLRWTGTQAAYDAIGTKDPNVLYVVV